MKVGEWAWMLQWGRDAVVLTSHGHPITGGILESWHCGVITAHCRPTTDWLHAGLLWAVLKHSVCLHKITPRSTQPKPCMHARDAASCSPAADSTCRGPDVCLSCAMWLSASDVIRLLTLLWPSYTDTYVVPPYLYSRVISLHTCIEQEVPNNYPSNVQR